MDTFISFLFALVVSFLFLVMKESYTIKSQTLCTLPPGPKPWPILGNLSEMLITNKQPAFRWIHGLMNELHTDIACVRLGNIHVILVKSPQIAREFLRTHDPVFASRPLTMTVEYISGGYLATVVVPMGEQWKKMRKLLATHIFNPSKLHFLRDKRDQEADNLVRFIYNQCKSSSSSSSIINVRLAARQYCGNVIRKMLFNKRYFGEGREDGGPGFEEEEHVESAFRVLKHTYAFSPSGYIPYLRLLDLDGHEKIVSECIRNIIKYQDPIIDERVKQWRDGKKMEAEDMLDLLILAKDSNGQHLSTEEIKAQCTDLVLASVDNPSNLVEWAMAEMISQPEILHKAIEEIDRVVGKERLVQESDLPSLRYVKACAREAFRLHPIAPFVPPHVSTADVIVFGYFIPKGSHVLLSRVELGRNPKVWEEPLQFKPDRHLKDDNARVELTEPNLKLISFSTGRRGCIGVHLGSTMTMMLLTRLLQGFSWYMPSEKKKINLTESRNDLFLKEPLHVMAKLRLPTELYSV